MLNGDTCIEAFTLGVIGDAVAPAHGCAIVQAALVDFHAEPPYVVLRAERVLSVAGQALGAGKIVRATTE
jgi:hypothetical protein